MSIRATEPRTAVSWRLVLRGSLTDPETLKLCVLEGDAVLVPKISPPRFNRVVSHINMDHDTSTLEKERDEASA